MTAARAFTLLALATAAVADFSLFPSVDPDQLASSLNVTAACLTALNETVQCDADLMRMALNVDDYFWSNDNLTDLCIDSDCLDEAGAWGNDVESACDGQLIVVNGKLVDVSTVADRYNDGLTIACTIDTTTDDFPFCLTESQDWVGEDIVRDDCTNDTCADPGNQRIANLYGDDILCSPCFLNLFYTRLSSPFLPDTDHSDDLINQYLDVVDVCNATQTMPELIVAGYPLYDNAPAPVFNSTTNNTCTGQQLPASAGSNGCDSLSTQYGVTTGDLQAVTDSDSCTFSSTICLPASCNLTQVTGSTTCDELASQVSTSSTNVSTTMFLGWNPNIIGLCNDVQAPQYICSGAPGGTYIPLAPNNTGTDAAGQNRYGSSNDSSIISTNPSTGTGESPGTGVSTGSGPSPTQDGIVTNCNLFVKAISGDYCYEFAQANNITEQQLYNWNTVLGPGGQNCTNEFFSDYYYCTGVNATQRTGPPPPDPHQSGIVPDCQSFAQAPNGSYCSAFAQAENITTAQLYTWNTILGPQGQNCSSEFFAGYYYCTAAPDSTSSTPSAPSPTQSGIISNCNTYAKAASGDYCYQFAQENNITTKQLYDWNTILGPNGNDCNTQFQAGENYCVGIEIPTPTQQGIASNCDLYAQATSGDYCYQFAGEHNITTDQLYTWNTVLGSGGSDCQNEFQTGEWYCVGVAS